MAFHNVTNNAGSTLTAAIGTTDLTLSVATDVFPAVPFYLTLGESPATYEIVEVTAKAGLNFTVTRAKDGTTAKSFLDGDVIQLFMVAALVTELHDNVVAHSKDYARQPGYALDTGEVDAMVIALDPAPEAYVAGMRFVVKVRYNNVISTPKINVNGLGQKSIWGADTQGLKPDTLLANTTYELFYNPGFAVFLAMACNLDASKLGGELPNKYALLASPDFTGVPTVPTAAVNTDTTQAASTAFVLAQSGDTFTTASRPTTKLAGYTCFDTTLSKPIWLKTAPSTWVDATGTGA